MRIYCYVVWRGPFWSLHNQWWRRLWSKRLRNPRLVKQLWIWLPSQAPHVDQLHKPNQVDQNSPERRREPWTTIVWLRVDDRGAGECFSGSLVSLVFGIKSQSPRNKWDTHEMICLIYVHTGQTNSSAKQYMISSSPAYVTDQKIIHFIFMLKNWRYRRKVLGRFEVKP